MGGWGLGPWGLGPWGFEGASGLTIESVTAFTERSVVVQLSKAPRHMSTIVVGDALNPKTWTVTDRDSGASLLVLAVRDTGSGSAFELFLLEKLSSSLVSMRVGSTTLVDTSGALIDPPFFFDTPGCKAPSVSRSPVALVDVANVPASPDLLSGTLLVGTDGDYLVQSGSDFLRKLIIRRITTTPGDFTFLPSYGVGLASKEPIPASDMVKLQAALELQITREPEIAKAKVVLTLTPDSVLTIQVAAVLSKTNQQVVVSIPVTSPQVAF